MHDRDFALSVFVELIAAARESGYRFLTVGSYLGGEREHPRFLILRHDVDRRPENALQMAIAEASRGVCSTYYFRFNPRVFKKEIVKRIVELGHEIGYHYEVMDKARGDPSLARRLFESELAEIRAQTEVSTVCMHGNPFSPFDNRDFWRHFNPDEFGLAGEAYESIKDQEIFYATDTGRGWNRTRYNFKDRFADGSTNLLPSRESTADLIDLLRSGDYPKLYLQVHPSRWSAETLQWYRQYFEDICINTAKRLYSFLDTGRSGTTASPESGRKRDR
jgi:hypothetical protein